ncbi:CLUMA_CG005020, isoform A [Clunio marinus]|uniref:CLUMA_CG005020, isoform A n=1 Tax=Clunio marinus TaxID=568069 RepID=A0A1J1HTM8_9DIPT|nr:CLUMA_CG005020, isoform A [Clunio marinus]
MSVKKAKTIHNKEVFQRVNFLLQANKLMAGKNNSLACYYGSLMKQLQKKSVLKIDSSIKRDLCKRCSIFLTPTTSEISVTEESLGIIKCNRCGYEKKYPINDYYKLWSEEKESIVEEVIITCD